MTTTETTTFDFKRKKKKTRTFNQIVIVTSDDNERICESWKENTLTSASGAKERKMNRTTKAAKLPWIWNENGERNESIKTTAAATMTTTTKTRKSNVFHWWRANAVDFSFTLQNTIIDNFVVFVDTKCQRNLFLFYFDAPTSSIGRCLSAVA